MTHRDADSSGRAAGAYQHRKVLGRWDSVAIVIGIVIGVGIFRVPAEVARYLQSPLAILGVWAAGGVISLLGAVCYAELAAAFPRTGGDYVFLKESYGKMTGFLFGWTQMLVICAGSIAAVAYIFAEYLQSFFGFDSALVRPFAVFVVALLTIVNLAGLHYGRRVQNFFTLSKVAALLVIIAAGLLVRQGSVANLTAAAPPAVLGPWTAFGLALIPVLFTYGGWHENTYVGGETKDAAKSLPFALITGVVIITILYMLVNFFYLYVMPPSDMACSELIASEVLFKLFGLQGRKVLEALVIVSSLGSINAMIITGSRVTYALSSENRLFRYLGEIDPATGAPKRAVIANGTWTMLLIIFGTFHQLVFFTGILMWLFLALVISGIFILRRKHPHMERPFRLMGYPYVPAVFVLVCLVIFLNTLLHDPYPSLTGLGLFLSGIPIYFLSERFGTS
ncbi:MAG TPA: amino acid permease [bacterium]|nr:amino acid permease [bacterium]